MASLPPSERGASGGATGTDVIDRPTDARAAQPPLPPDDAPVLQPRLGPIGWVRFVWRQLTSMRTALFLLLLLAVAAVPGSLFPQRSSDPNGVIQYQQQHPDTFKALDALGLFSVYTSPWFSAVYLLLFISLVGCVIPRTKHHIDALRTRPPRTPMRMERLPVFRQTHIELPEGDTASGLLDDAHAQLKRQGYRVERYTSAPGAARAFDSVSGERGYLRETGNLLFHTALLGVLVSVGIGGGFSYTGQKVVIEGTSFTNVLTSYDSFTKSRFFNDTTLQPYSIKVDKFSAKYGINPQTGQPQPLDYAVDVTTTLQGGTPQNQVLKVNAPLEIGGTQVYLLGNGYAPSVTVRDAAGQVIYSGPRLFISQDANLTSQGVIKLPDAPGGGIAFEGFFYPSASPLSSGALTSVWPEPLNPELTLFLFTGDLKLNSDAVGSDYTLDTDGLTQVAGVNAPNPSIKLTPGETQQLPNGLGSITFDGYKRFVSLDIHHDPTQGFVLVFVLIGIAGLITSLFVPRRRVWVKAVPDGDRGVRLEYAGLARGEDPGLERAVAEVAERHARSLPASEPTHESRN